MEPIYRPFTYKGSRGIIFADDISTLWFSVANDKSYGVLNEEPKGIDLKERADTMEQYAKEKLDMVCE